MNSTTKTAEKIAEELSQSNENTKQKGIKHTKRDLKATLRNRSNALPVY
jgi:hypothetical protein